MKIVKICVLSGGPSALKTSALPPIHGYFSILGWIVLIAPEAATLIINGGAFPKDVPSKNFQTAVLRLQKTQERNCKYLAHSMKGKDKALIICDRGALDNKAYSAEKTFQELLRKFKTDEVTLRNSYDAVFHMVTAADGAEQFYTCEDNPARSETLEEARELDLRLKTAWSEHPYHRIIDNSGKTADDKIKKLRNEMCVWLGEPIPIDIKRAFRVKMPDFGKISCITQVTSMQTYQEYLICADPHKEIKIKQRICNGSYMHFYTEKSRQYKLCQPSKEYIIGAKEYNILHMYADPALNPIRKTKHCFIANDTYFECDVYPFWENQAILEVKFSFKEQLLSIPSFIDVIDEVTDDERYKNRNMAEKIPS